MENPVIKCLNPLKPRRFFKKIMKILHLADLHIGKRVNEISMLTEQRHILQQILTIVQREQPQAALLAGDIYDKTMPAAEAVQLCDWFLTRLSALVPAVLIIPGNHDSAERLAFAAGLLQEQGVYIAQPFAGQVQRVELADEFGPVDFYLLPFLKPAIVRRAFTQPETEAPPDLADYNEAVGLVMQQVNAQLRPRPVRNILLAHQLITGAVVCDSDELAIGGLDNVDVSWFADFDYVALGHLHSAQQVRPKQPAMRYCGSPLKYSFSEARQKKSLTLLEIDGDGQVQLQTTPLNPLHDLREIKGAFANLTAPDFLAAQDCADYLHITLTDEHDIPDAVLRLRQYYPNLMKLDYDNQRTRSNQRLALSAAAAESLVELGPFKLVSDFYEQQNNQRLDAEQEKFLQQLIEEIWDNKQEEPCAHYI